MTTAIDFDAGRHSRAKIGFVLLSSEQTVEDDMFAMIPPGVGVHFTRVANADEINVDTLRQMTDGLAPAASLLLPNGRLDVVCYACTSGSVVIGEDRVIHELRRGAPAATATTLVSGVVRALRALRAQRIVVATPYVDAINEIERQYLVSCGLDVLNIQGLNIARDSDMARVTPSYLLNFALSLNRDDADAIFISCSALRSIDIVDELERRTGKPVVVSNQAMAWNTLRLAGIKDSVQGYGRLLREH